MMRASLRDWTCNMGLSGNPAVPVDLTALSVFFMLHGATVDCVEESARFAARLMRKDWFGAGEIAADSGLAFAVSGGPSA